MDVVHGLTSSSAAKPASAAAAGADFGQALAAAAGNAVKTLRSSESVSMAGIEGKASVQQVTESVMQAERTLQTAIAIRDKAVTAWQQISQMQI
jgi:flagellar hook-basal body complex protein FliE